MRKFLLFSLIFIFVFSYYKVDSVHALAYPIATPTPLPPYPTITETQKNCDQINKDTVYPPNGECNPEVTKVETAIDKYPLTCVLPPEVIYKETVTGTTPPATVDVIVTDNVAEAQLGGYGPSLSVLSASTNMDDIAKQYLFNGLFDKPFYKTNNTPREAYRTYWRYLNSFDQANIKADYLSRAGKSIKNVYWNYVDLGGNVHETNAKELKGELPGCLKSNPVCDTYYDEYLKLNENTRNKYDTLLPYNFDDQRGFLVLNSQISRENISYLNAIYNAATGNNGLFNFYTPSAFIKPAETFSITTNETSLDSKVLAKGTISSCSPPPKTSSLAAPKTYPNITALVQTVRIHLDSKLINTTPGYCSGGTYCDSYYESSSCSAAGCSWTDDVNTWELSGKAVGKPIGVLNNPVVDAITHIVNGDKDKEIPSFFKMMLPDFAKIPDKVDIAAPSVTTSTNNPNAVVLGASTINRVDNQAQDSMVVLQNCWLIPADQQKSSKCPKKIAPTCNANKPLDNPAGCSMCSTFLDSRIPPELKTLIEAAASKYSVPPSLILAQMFAEGGFESRCTNGGYTASDITDCKISACGKCNVYNGEDGGPFGWMSIYFKPLMKQVNKDFGLPDSNGDMCNMWDSAMASTKELSTGANGGYFAAALASYEAAVNGHTGDDPNSCMGVPYNNGGKTGNSCDKSSWTKSDVMSAIRAEQGFCGENIDENTKGGLPFTQLQMLDHIYNFLAIYNCDQDLHDASGATADQLKAWIQEEISKIP
ncbi:MAG TPA: hypothetical protein VF837_02665 [Patescibacteria group bacterium]